jgi:hypothetical protein
LFTNIGRLVRTFVQQQSSSSFQSDEALVKQRAAKQTDEWKPKISRSKNSIDAREGHGVERIPFFIRRTSTRVHQRGIVVNATLPIMTIGQFETDVRCQLIESIASIRWR